MSFCLLLKILVETVGKKISKNLSTKCRPNYKILPNSPLQTHCLKKAIRKTAEATGDLVGNKSRVG